MNTYLTSPELKDRAKYQLEGKYGIFIGAILLQGLINLGISLFCAMLIPSTNLIQFIIYELIAFIVSVFLGVFNVGFCYMYLKNACGQPVSVSDIFYGFKDQFSKCLSLSLILTALTMVLNLSYLIPMEIYNLTGNLNDIYIMFLCYAIALVIYVPISLSLSQILYLLLDFPNKSVKELVSLSCQVMRGHKCRLFYINVSFIPLMLLSVLSFGVGFLWLMPYMEMTLSNFFLDLMHPHKQEKRAGEF